ncbi:MAG: sialidase family protein [Acidobacteriota bacterium]|nr:sialidase family protein [Acidobacteriota bacterium]
MNPIRSLSRLYIIPFVILAGLFLLPSRSVGRKGGPAGPAVPEPVQTDLFIAHEGGFHAYRIPALITTTKGTLLAFVEGRKDSFSDHGHNEILMRRSLDNGNTWTPMQVVKRDGTNALNNPTAVVDRDTGTVWLLFVRTSTKRYKSNEDVARATGRISDMWIMHSNDDGATWAGPANITKEVNQRGWNRIIPGPGVGIQLRNGRLMIPCNHVTGKINTDHIIYSDDHGKTWRLGGSTDDRTDEDQMVELADGTLMLNSRNYRDKGHRGISLSKDAGLTWSPVTSDPTLIEPVCEASLIRYTLSPAFRKNRLLFSNPATQDKRIRMTVRLSYDEGKTWPVAKLLNPESSSYSCLTVLHDMQIGCLYERADHGSAQKVTFARFSLEWLTDGADSLGH